MEKDLRFATDCRDLCDRFFYLRHAETDFHADRRLCGGGSDPGLNEAGMKQASEVSLSLKKAKLGVKTICSSDLLRCVQTADFVHDRIAGKIRVFEALRERRFGEWEGRSIVEIRDWDGLTDRTPPGGETLDAFTARVKDSILHCLRLPGPVVFVCHGFFGKRLQQLLGIEPTIRIPRARWFEFSAIAGGGGSGGPRWAVIER